MSTQTVYVTRPKKGYGYASGKAYDMPSDHANEFLQGGYGLRPDDVPEQPEPPEIGTDLPDDIPYREELYKAGFNRYQTLLNHKSLATIRGIGPERAEELKAYLQGGDKSSDYTIAELKEMDLSDKDSSFFEGDDRSSVDQFK